MNRTQNRRFRRSCFVIALMLIVVHRLPAPIVEETPGPERPKTKPAKAAAVTSRDRKSATAPSAAANTQELHVVFSDSARSAMQYLRTYAANWEQQPFAGKSDVHADEIVEKLRSVLSARFRHLTISSESFDTLPERSGLTMVFDLQAHIGGFAGQSISISPTGTFKDSNGRALYTVSASGVRALQMLTWNVRFQETVDAAFVDFSQKLDAARRVTAH